MRGRRLERPRAAARVAPGAANPDLRQLDAASSRLLQPLRGRDVGSVGAQPLAHEVARIVQRRPIIGLSSDPAEAEADRLGDRVMISAVPGAATSMGGPNPGGSDGRPLSPGERATFEPRLGHDLSRVRVHEDSAAQDSARALDARAYSVGEHIVLGRESATTGVRPGFRLLAHELAHVVIAARTAGTPTIRRSGFGTDGTLSPQRQAVVKAAAGIAENLVTSHDFARKWDSFWRGPFALATPRPSLAAYQAAVRGRVVHDMDTSTNPAVRAIVSEERDLPLERQTAGVTAVGSTDTYLREFAIDQGVDSVVSLLLHESFHGAGVPMGPVGMLYEPLMHGFEAGAGFPMFMGGADIVTIKQIRRGDYDVEFTVTYNLRRIDVPLPADIEIQVVSPDTGDIIYQEEPGTTRQPVRHEIDSRPGTGTWVWHARYVGLAPLTVRIIDADGPNVMASRPLVPDPRCVLGVSSVHCEDE